MGKWLIAIILGIAVVVGVYFLREHIVSTPIGGTELPAPQRDENVPDVLATPPAEDGSAPDDNHEAPVPDIASPAEPTIPPGSAASLISVDFPWARESVAGTDVTAVYMLLTNGGQADAYLIGAECKQAGRVEIHQTVVDGSVVSMRAVSRLDLEPGVPTALEQGGLHLMVMGLKHPLKVGDTLDITLDFGTAGTIDITVPVGEPDDTDSNPLP